MKEMNKQTSGIFYIKLGWLIFWACWFSVAFSTNIFDFINVFHPLPHWHFRSGNYDALAKVFSIYQMSPTFLNLIFSLDIFADGLSALLFFLSAISFWRFRVLSQIINITFGISMALWGIFMVFEEIFIAYTYEDTHLRLFAFEMLTFLAMHLLPHHMKNHIKRVTFS